MAYMGNLKAGDRVKVTFEADVTHGSSFGVDLSVGNGRVTIREESFPGVEFEKIEPPVEVFKPGDVVRSKATGHVRVITDKGWVNLRDGKHYVGPNDDFTSDKYERVTLE